MKTDPKKIIAGETCKASLNGEMFFIRSIQAPFFFGGDFELRLVSLKDSIPFKIIDVKNNDIDNYIFNH